MARYQYETSPRKLEPEYQPRKKKTTSKNSSPAKKQIQKKAKESVKAKNQEKRKKKKVVLYVVLIFGVLLAISYRNSLITESFSKVRSLKSDLATIEKENQQLQVSIESSLNFNTIEQEAKARLGMQKLNNNQKVYVSLPKKDYVEPASEEVKITKEENLFQNLLNSLKGK